MKLELKHLAPYLPYGLIIRYDNRNIEMDLSISAYKKQIGIKTVIYWQFCNDAPLPILHPLSDLTKEIEVNGEKFVPLDKINKTFYEKNHFRQVDAFFDIELDTDYGFDSVSIINEAVPIYNYVLSLHFDIFGLIENNLAIDINTLNK